MERGHGPAVAGTSHLADGDPRLFAVRGPIGLRLAQPRRREPRDLSRRKDSMRTRIVMLLAFVIAAVAVGFTGARFTYLPAPHPTVHAPLPSALDSYLGVFEPGTPPSYQPIEDFAKAAGKAPNLVGYYSGWAQPFSMSFAETVHKHGVIPFVQIDPTFASVPAIAAGDYDTYLRLYADSVRDFGHQVVIGFGHEMNAPYYSWGYGRVAPATFVAAWQHVVSLFRTE